MKYNTHSLVVVLFSISEFNSYFHFQIKLELSRQSEDYKVTSFHISKMCVCKDDEKSVKFKIIPNKLGRIPLTVKAITSEAKFCPKSTVYAADAVSRKLLVEVGLNHYYDIPHFS
jgi:hypothetical protein